MFPCFVYRKHPKGLLHVAGVGMVAYRSVADEAEQAALIAQGWVDSIPALTAPAVVQDDDAPPTRAELEQKARELGLTWHHKTGDAKLAAMIAEAVGG